MQIAATTSQWFVTGACRLLMLTPYNMYRGLVLEVFGAISLIVVVLFPLISAAKSWPAVR